MASGNVDVVDSRGCSRLVVGISSSFTSYGSHRFVEPMSPASSAVSAPLVRPAGPFSGLVICVTGLSKEARKQVMAAVEKLGGQYSGNLHPQCTHLVVQSFGGRKFEHALKHGSKNGQSVVTLGWFVDSVRRNVRMSESLYSVKSTGENGLPMRELNWPLGSVDSGNSCLPATLLRDHKPSDIHGRPLSQLSEDEASNCNGPTLAGNCIYIDPDLSNDLRRKVYDAAARLGATTTDNWFRGCNASHVVCERPSIQRYIGHAINLVTPLWMLKTVKERKLQRLVHLSADLAKQIGMMLENFQTDRVGQSIVDYGPSPRKPFSKIKRNDTVEERKQMVLLAKMDVRSRRPHIMQSHQIPICPINPRTLLDSICWSISEPTSAASIYIEHSPLNDISDHSSVFFDAQGDARDLQASFDHCTRPLKESEREELIFKNHFLTILFPLDRFGELGPSSRTFFSSKGFSCIQVLDHIYRFYHENMSEEEIEIAIHTDSKHADRLRSVYASESSLERGFVSFKRIEFIGFRRSFEMLKRVSGDNNSNVYELLVRA